MCMVTITVFLRYVIRAKINNHYQPTTNLQLRKAAESGAGADAVQYGRGAITNRNK